MLMNMTYGENDPLASLRELYRIVEKPKCWELFCLKCPKAFVLAKSANLHTGNILPLFNHAASHDVPYKDEDAVDR
jgi:hypothetical protein